MSSEADRIWFEITNAGPPDPDQYWVLHNDRIEKKAATLKREELKFRYAELWRVYEEVAQASITKADLPALTPSSTTESPHNLSAESTDSASVDFPVTNLNVNIDPNNFATTDVQHHGETTHITLRLFHWHLSGDDLSEPGLGTRLNKMSDNLVKLLQKSGLKPDVFIFTGTNAITGFRRGYMVDKKYMKKLCTKLWKYIHKRSPSSFDCNQVPVYLSDGSTQESNIQWASNLLVISPHPIRMLKTTDTVLQECAINMTYRFAYFRLLQVTVGRKKANLLVFSSRESIFNEELVKTSYWGNCVSHLKESLNSKFGQKSPIIVVSHINAPYFTFQDFAKHLNANIRPLFDKTDELTLTNQLGQMFIEAFPTVQKMAPRYSAVMSYRPVMDQLFKLSLKAHMAPPYFYQSFQGTPQRFLNWDGYAPLHPSYTELTIETTDLHEVTEVEQRVREMKNKIEARQLLH